MTTATLREGGQVTLPQEFLRAAGVGPGDLAVFEVTGPDTVQIKVIPRSALPAVEDVPGAVTSPAEHDDLPVLTPADLFERYRIEGPVDEAADRESWHDEAAKDVFGERPDRWPA